MSRVREAKERLKEQLPGLATADYGDWNLGELKTELVKRGLISRGNKNTLVGYLRDDDDGRYVKGRLHRGNEKSPKRESESPRSASPRSASPRSASPRSASPVQAESRSSSRSPRGGTRTRGQAKGPDEKDEEEHIEFGGPVGATLIMILSHVVVYYLWIGWQKYGGKLPLPDEKGFVAFVQHLWNIVITQAVPNAYSLKVYWGFLLWQGLMAWGIPGLKMRGLPIRHLGGLRLEYNCNGIFTWYLTLMGCAALQYFGHFDFASIYHNFGPLLSTAVLTQDAFAVVMYVSSMMNGSAHRLSGNRIYDFFMGAPLNPRIGSLDLKFWFEVRVAWCLLFLLTCSAAVHQHATYGEVTPQMWFMILAHFLYANACHKGEECIPTTWDIFHEKFGWMLIFWNGAGVPLVYCLPSWFIATHSPNDALVRLPNWVVVMMTIWLLVAYCLWDVTQRQRNSFRMKLNGTFVERATFPQLPGGVIDPATARYIKTDSGSLLLADGLWRYARKLHYTCDIAMALSWGASCGFHHILPFFYPAFFIVMIGHRTTRDLARCERKYGHDWDRYKQEVPYLFIPYVF